MRPYNTYRNPELSQPVSSVENTLSTTNKTSNSNLPFDILLSLSESISVDCGSFEISSPREYHQTSSAPSPVAFVAPSGKEIRTPADNVSAATVNKEPPIAVQTSQMSSGNATTDMDDDNYDCMNDPNYRAQGRNNANVPSFEELMARTAEGLAKMREETRAAISNSESSKEKKESTSGSDSNTSRSETRSDAKPSQSKPLAPEKSMESNNRWNKTRKLLFSKETIKLVFLSVAISALIVSAVIYRSSPRRNSGLTEMDEVVVDQPAVPNQNAPVQGNAIENNDFMASSNGEYWGQADDNNWNNSVANNRKTMTDSLQDDYMSSTIDVNPIEYNYNQNDTNSYFSSEDAGRQLASPHSLSNENEFADNMPVYNVKPKYAEVSPAFGSRYIPDEYESPVLEDDSVRGYSETGYNSNFMR